MAMTILDWPFITPGIPDAWFTRDRVPLTKEEIRVLTLAKARLGSGMTVYDIGAGTGSLAVEAARLVAPGLVLAVEVNPLACDLIRQNSERFNLGNLQVVAGEAPEVLAGLPAPDRVLIGGSGGRLKDILARCHNLLHPGGIIVINAITPETLTTALTFGQGRGYRVAALAASLARLEPAGRVHFWRSLNPVHIVQLIKE
ncbi:precorrin-6B methylase 2 [Moorella thermoacetica Y72]|uniref:Precorrin-6B methylase 2 n=3 Tax=Neomoorella thermoacetica TaxID=1525 RepID=A0A0S6UF51_NEOTH|nr:putative cobalt-precorrin-6Y C(15)-methyltransferase [Moorella thermoacetica]GAF26836.1 precorrin-6B methylase 2 [Moorella thermoacetica Y72]